MAALLALLTACGGGGGGNTAGGGNTGGGGSVNTAPTAVITQSGTAEVGKTLSFDASKSSDAEGDSLRYAWTLTTAPANSKAVLDAPDGAKTNLVPDRGGIYEVSLVVSDGKADSARVRQSVTVTSNNHAPVADYLIFQPLIPGESMQLDASRSHDADGDALTFKWTVLSTPPGASASFTDATSAKPELVAQQAGDYLLKLEVSDGESTDTRTIPVIVNHRPIVRVASVPLAVPGREVVLDASASSDPDGDPLTFQWGIASIPRGSQVTLSSASSSKARFTPDVGGTYAFWVDVKDKYTGNRSSNLYFVTANNPPVARITAPASARLNSTVTLDAGKSSDVENSPLAYAWRLTSQPAGSQARLDDPAARQPRFDVDLAGSYGVSLVVNDGLSDSESDSATITVAATGDTPITSGVTMTPQPALPGQDIQFSARMTDPKGLALSYRWQFSDGTTASGASVTRRFASAGSYDVSVVATNSQGLSADPMRVTARVVGQIVGGLSPACTGANCGAVGVNRYTGSGTGIWAQTNTTAEDQGFNLDIDNVAPGRSIMLLISNGSSRAAPSLPDFGQAAAGAVAAKASLRRTQAASSLSQSRRDEAHGKLQQRNEALLKAYARSAAPLRKALGAKALAAGRAGAPPALHSRRTWQGSLGEPAYDASVEATCALPGGRNAVFWVDTTSLTNGLVSATTISDFSNFYCGNSGAYAQLTALTGDVWGASADATLIGDDTLQDVNILLGDPKSDVGWGGYFSFANNFRKSQEASSNEALVFVLNMRMLATSRNYLMSSLVHESMHMVNAFQRTVKLGITHESWLEETTAMMSEDIVVPGLLKNEQGQPYDDMASGRLPFFMWMAGGVSYTADPNGTNLYTYAHGGVLGAFVTRRYGTSLFKRLLTDCSDYAPGQDSYTCFDTAIKNSGGTNLATEIVQMAASVMSPLSPAQSPAGYGFAQRSEGIYLLPTLDPTYIPGVHQDHSPALSGTFGATTFVYISDAVPAGSTRYRRSGVIVPPGATLQLVIR